MTSPSSKVGGGNKSTWARQIHLEQSHSALGAHRTGTCATDRWLTLPGLPGWDLCQPWTSGVISIELCWACRPLGPAHAL